MSTERYTCPMPLIRRTDLPRTCVEFADLDIGAFFAMGTDEVLCMKISDTEFFSFEYCKMFKFDPSKSNKVAYVYAEIEWSTTKDDSGDVF